MMNLIDVVLSTNNTCPTDGSATCLGVDGQDVDRFISPLRNCDGGSGPECTIQDPCFPCELDTITSFLGGRCQACTTDNPGNCNFVPGVGPYCFESVDSFKVVPCTRCCTPNTPILVGNKCF